MNINSSKNIKISQHAMVKIINDFFSNVESDVNEYDFLDSKELSMHAGAFCLYAAILISKIHETNPDAIEIESNEREIALQTCIRNSSKYKHLTEEQIQNKAHQMMSKDIRNSFAHGNLKINYDFIKNDLYFVLLPQRKDFDIDIPIIISKNSIKDAIIQSSFNFIFSSEDNLESMINNDLSNLLKLTLIPTQMMKMADYYLQSPDHHTDSFTVDPKRYMLIKHILLVTKITYEQDDYYNIFGKDSEVFKTISLIRNSIAHDCFLFTELAKNINYTDQERTINESLNKSVMYLSAVDKLKNIISSNIAKGRSLESIQELKEKLSEYLQLYFDNIDEASEFTENNL